MNDSHTLIFMGLKHCGKSVLGGRLARRLGFAFEDLDHLIMGIAGDEGYASIRELYRTVGLENFQDYETAALDKFFDFPETEGLILSLGGGTVENPSAMEIAKTRGVLVHLSVEEQVLYDRIIPGGIPPFLQGERSPRHMFHELFLHRSELYRRYADMSISLPDQSVGDNTELIYSRLKEQLYVR